MIGADSSQRLIHTREVTYQTAFGNVALDKIKRRQSVDVKEFVHAVLAAIRFHGGVHSIAMPSLRGFPGSRSQHPDGSARDGRKLRSNSSNGTIDLLS